ncbi:hypothetical protein C6B38_02805 [Spiroplasma sp. ChiS]|uniref:lipoprotein n=1 Tax=Spiroplasma sp. ChiS TaxID=2099885 RepID=UPI000CF904C0|nr:lipoprotein [Spiroplasma sp. ChiS]PQP79001.1 hypothetical protein C6B38_02805 [Spiroplasma sp. ChiS]
MKKLLSIIIGAIGLTATSTTTLISCKKENDNENDKNTPTKKSQQPPKDSNWKLIENNYMWRNTGWYIVIHKDSNLWKIEKINSSEKYGTRFFSDIVYKWELNNEPQIPTINQNTGEIIDWKEQKGTE